MTTAVLTGSAQKATSGAAKRTRLGELLVAEGAITEAQLAHALREQQKLKLPLGQTLLSLNYLTDEAIRQALSHQLKVPFIDLPKMQLDPALARVISRAYAKRYALVPVSRIGQTLTVAIDDPTATGLSVELSRLTGLTVTLVTATSEAIQRAFAHLYEHAAAPTPAIAPVDGPVSAAPVLSDSAAHRADKLFGHILERSLAVESSDIHLEMLGSGLRIRFRSDGLLRPATLGTIQPMVDKMAREIVSRVKILAKLDIAERRRPQDGSFRAPVMRAGRKTSVDLRVSVIPSYSGESVVIRVLERARAPRSIAELRLSPRVSSKLETALQRTSGVLLVTGPTGSGKSTTLYSCLMKLYRPEIRILTAEDPVEYVYEELSQSEVNHTIGNTFAQFLRSFLRHDPEVIMVGEIRDEETAEMAFRAAQTGHLLLSTMHTNSAIAALPRLKDLKIEPSLIGSSLIGVMSQRLARQVCNACREPGAPPELIHDFFGDVTPNFTLYQPSGCAECSNTGYRGRALLVDLWIPDEQDLMLIARDAPFDEIVRSAERTTISMAQDSHDRLRGGQTTLQELHRVLPYTAITEHRALVTSGRA